MTARRLADAMARRSLPRLARGDPAAGARVLADLIPEAIAKAEALGAGSVAGHLRMALLVAERRAAERGGAKGRARC